METYDRTLDALQRCLEQLEHAVTAFPPGLDEQAFATAWGSDDPSERNRAAAVLANFERTYMLLMDLIALSVKIGNRLGALDADEQSSAIVCLREKKVIRKRSRMRSKIRGMCETQVSTSTSSCRHPPCAKPFAPSWRPLPQWFVR
jgi:hypothetical protein